MPKINNIIATGESECEPLHKKKLTPEGGVTIKIYFIKIRTCKMKFVFFIFYYKFIQVKSIITNQN